MNRHTTTSHIRTFSEGITTANHNISHHLRRANLYQTTPTTMTLHHHREIPSIRPTPIAFIDPETYIFHHLRWRGLHHVGLQSEFEYLWTLKPEFDRQFYLYFLISIPCPPDNNPNKDVVDNRLFGFEEPENKPIWHSQLVPNRNQQHHQGGGSGNLRPVENNKIDGKTFVH